MRKFAAILALLGLLGSTAYAAEKPSATLTVGKTVELSIPKTGTSEPVVVWITDGDEDIWYNLYSADELGEKSISIPEIALGDTLTVKLTGAYDETFTLAYDNTLIFADFAKKFSAAKESEVVSLLTEYKDYMQSSTYIGRLGELSGKKLNLFINQIVNATFNDFTSLGSEIDKAAKIAFDYVEPTPGGNGSSGGGGGGSVIGGSKTPGNTSVTVEELTPAADAAAFGDLDSVPWAAESINMLAKLGIVSGTDGNNFEPDRNITRAEFVKMLFVVFDECEDIADCELTDIAASDWFYPYVANAYRNGLVSGNDAGEFLPYDAITRQDAAAIIWRCLNTYKRMPDKARDYAGFDDDKNISEYAKDAVKELYSRNVINGISDSEFAPQQSCTRAMAARLIAGIIGGTK